MGGRRGGEEGLDPMQVAVLRLRPLPGSPWSPRRRSLGGVGRVAGRAASWAGPRAASRRDGRPRRPGSGRKTPPALAPPLGPVPALGGLGECSGLAEGYATHRSPLGPTS